MADNTPRGEIEDRDSNSRGPPAYSNGQDAFDVGENDRSFHKLTRQHVRFGVTLGGVLIALGAFLFSELSYPPLPAYFPEFLAITGIILVLAGFWVLRRALLQGHQALIGVATSRQGLTLRLSDGISRFFSWSDRELRVEMYDYRVNPTNDYGKVPCVLYVRHHGFILSGGLPPEAVEAIVLRAKESGVTVAEKRDPNSRWFKLGAA